MHPWETNTFRLRRGLFPTGGFEAFFRLRGRKAAHIPTATPMMFYLYMLLNFNGKDHGTRTLAHETAHNAELFFK